MSSKLSPTKQLASKTVYNALLALRERGGELPSNQVLAEVEARTVFNEWETAIYEKTGYTRWKSILAFFSIDLIKAGFIIKNKGIWYLTPEGEEAIKLGERELLEQATKAYKSWKKSQQKSESTSTNLTDEGYQDEEGEKTQEITIQEMEDRAVDGLEQRIRNLNPYEFQDLVGALLRGMGYFTPFIAPKGKDGGIDIIAYQDPLGVKSPRVKVQVKHRGVSASVDEIRQLMGLLQRDGDIGIFVSTGGFTSDSKITARSSHIHVELIDLERFIALWVEFYPKLNDEDKNLLRLKPIYFYDPSI